MCCIRMDSRELVGNFLGCEELDVRQRIDMEALHEYCKQMRQVLPGYVLFENSLSEVRKGTELWESFANWDAENQAFYLKTEDHPSLQKINGIYPNYLSKTIEEYTEYFVCRYTNKTEKSFLEWFLDKPETDHMVAVSAAV